jgi:hypothetical protein
MKKANRKQKNLAAFAKETLSKIEIDKLKGGDDPNKPPLPPPPPIKGGG